MISGHERTPRSGNAKQLVVILHGWGADGANLIDLADLWANQMPDAHFCAPNAHEICEVNPYGFQWFSLMDRSPLQMMRGVDAAAIEVNAFLDAKLKEAGAAQLMLVGFSQGTMAALHVGLRREDVSCVLGYSGSLLADESSIRLITHKPDVCLIHGEQDDVVPFASMANAKALLEVQGIEVKTHARPGLGHSIDMEGLAIGGKFLVDHVG